MNSDIKIPIQNIYYLLCYAWNKLDEKDIVDVSGIDSTNIVDLFAKVLIGGLSHLLRRGLDRGYVNFSEDTRCLRGKICFAPTVKKNLLINAKVHCEFNELCHDVLHNRILKATIRLLITTELLDTELKDQLIGLYRMLHEIGDIELNRKTFSIVQLHRNNSFYDFLLKICELICDNLLVSEAPGKSKFRDFIQDEKQMAYLFEEFARNFYKIEAKGYNVRREDILWAIDTTDDEIKSLLPKMVTDISIRKDDKKVIIDTKFYKEALIKHRGKEKIRSGHLYQLHSYLTNLEYKGGINEFCNGVLLYPSVEREFNKTLPMKNHKIIVRTIKLNQDWRMIHDDLMETLNYSLAC